MIKNLPGSLLALAVLPVLLALSGAGLQPELAAAPTPVSVPTLPPAGLPSPSPVNLPLSVSLPPPISVGSGGGGTIRVSAAGTSMSVSAGGLDASTTAGPGGGSGLSTTAAVSGGWSPGQIDSAATSVADGPAVARTPPTASLPDSDRPAPRVAAAAAGRDVPVICPELVFAPLMAGCASALGPITGRGLAPTGQPLLTGLVGLLLMLAGGLIYRRSGRQRPAGRPAGPRG